MLLVHCVMNQKRHGEHVPLTCARLPMDDTSPLVSRGICASTPVWSSASSVCMATPVSWCTCCTRLRGNCLTTGDCGAPSSTRCVPPRVWLPSLPSWPWTSGLGLRVWVSLPGGKKDAFSLAAREDVEDLLVELVDGKGDHRNFLSSTDSAEDSDRSESLAERLMGSAKVIFFSLMAEAALGCCRELGRRLVFTCSLFSLAGCVHDARMAPTKTMIPKSVR
mmetsp:Transcript_84703/g.218319  ORF Transcript_84703/g.218319 Transcript_84703/m.218319 type:complete len:221 (-) Transcript_84703:38-700(-)